MMKLDKLALSLLLSFAFSLPIYANDCGETVKQAFSAPDGVGEGVCMKLSAGSLDGAYTKTFGTNFVTYMSEYGFGEFGVIESRGSGENLKRISKGVVAFGLAQKDVQIYLEHKHKGKIEETDTDLVSSHTESNTGSKEDSFKYKDVVLVTELSDECIYVAYNKNKSTQSFADMQKKYTNPTERPFINIGKVGSGSFYSWKMITALNPKYGYQDKANSVYYGMSKKIDSFDSAIESLKNPDSNTHAVMWVIDPNIKGDSKKYQAVLNDPNLEFMPFNDAVLTQEITDSILSKEHHKDLLGSEAQEANAVPANTESDVANMLAGALQKFETPDTGTQTQQVSGAGSKNAYKILDVVVNPEQGSTIPTICTRAALYAHRSLTDKRLKVEDAFYDGDDTFWYQMLNLIQEFWPEIITQQK